MKKFLSLVLCIAMLTSFVSLTGITVSAANANTLMSVTSPTVKDGKVTLTVNLNSGINKFTGSVVLFEYDPAVLSVASAGAATYLNGDGEETLYVSGIYEKGPAQYYTDATGTEISLDPASNYSVGYVNTSGYTNSSAAKPFIKIVFDIVSDTAPSTTVTVRCNEFGSDGASVAHGSYQVVSAQTFSTLGIPTLKSVANDTDGINFVWNAVKGADSYTVYRKAVGGSTSAWSKLAEGVAENSYIDTTAVSGTTYTYTVRATNASGISGYNSTGLTLLCLAVPENAKVAISGAGAKISWSAVAGAESYLVYRRAATASSYTRIANLGASVRSYLDTGLQSGVDYVYKVRAYTSGTAGQTTDALSLGYLARPELVSLANAYNGPRIKWNAVEGAAGYRIYRKTTGGWGTVADVAATVTSYDDKTAVSGVTYTYTVRACDENGPKSAYESGLKLRYMAAPRISSVTYKSNDTFIKWNKVAGASGYYVYRKTSTSGWSRVATIKSGSTVTYRDTTAKYAVKYYYTVRSYYGSVGSSYNATGWAGYLIAAPKLVSAKSYSSGILFNWAKVSGAKGYVVYRKTAGTSWTRIATVSGGSTVKYLDKTAKKGITYTYTVRGFNGSYYSAYYGGISCKDKY